MLAVRADAADDRRGVDDRGSAASLARYVADRARHRGDRAPLARGARISAGCSRSSRSRMNPPRKPPPPVRRTRRAAPESLIAVFRCASSAARREVGVDHQIDQLLEVVRGVQPSCSRAFVASPSEQVDFRRTQVTRIDARRARAARRVDAHSSFPSPRHSSSMPARANARSQNSRTRVRLAGGDHEVVRLVLLQHQPHRLDVVLRVAPVALARRGCRGTACPAARV